MNAEAEGKFRISQMQQRGAEGREPKDQHPVKDRLWRSPGKEPGNPEGQVCVKEVENGVK